MCLAMPGGAEWQNRVRVWDLPTRVFHWALAALVAAALVTGWIGGDVMVWHGRIGIAIAGLLAFRIVWGFVGSSYARFTQFVRGPAAIRTYLAGRWRGVGHNPLGALSVLAMLAALCFQVGSGLFGNDDIAFQGPLAVLVSNDTSTRLTGLHRIGVWLTLTLVVLHLGAIMAYAHVKKDNLVLPMLRGWRERTDNAADSAEGGGFRAFVLALAIALLAAYAASGGLNPPPPPPAAGQAPDF